MPPALRHRPHQKTRPRRRPDHAQPRQKPAPGPRLPQNDRQRLPASSTPLTSPPAASVASPSTLGKPQSPCHARFPAIHLVSAAFLSNKPPPPQKIVIPPPDHDPIQQHAPPMPTSNSCGQMLDLRHSAKNQNKFTVGFCRGTAPGFPLPGCVKRPTSRCERPIRHSRTLLRHSRESGNPGVVEGSYSGVSPLHPAWIPAFAGMTEGCGNDDFGGLCLAGMAF